MDGKERLLVMVEKPGTVVSLVGGGGKSTLMYYLAEHFAGRGSKVLVSTTTHIFRPRITEYAADARRARELWREGKYAVIGTEVPGTEKLTQPDSQLLDELIQEADLVLLESDGAKGYPCKMPRTHEPVLHPKSNMVAAVFGMSALGRPLWEVCFGLTEAEKLLGVDEDHVLTASDGAELIATGGRKNIESRRFCAVLNQCDGDSAIAGELADMLSQKGIESVFCTGFSPVEREKYRRLAKGC